LGPIPETVDSSPAVRAFPHLKTTTAPALHCIHCGSELLGSGGSDLARTGATGFDCTGCGSRFPVHAGIVDLRPPLPEFDVESDRRLAEALLVARPDSDFPALLRLYWSHRCNRPERLVDRFVRLDLIGAERASRVAEQIEELAGGSLTAAATVLEVGAGTAALGSVLAHRASHVIISDISLAWLVIASFRVQSAGQSNVGLVACAGERLPFRDATFDLVVAADVIEHVADPAGLARSCYRVLRHGGLFWLSTPNRYSLTPEPHVRLWGVGLLPRRLAVAYVRRARGVDYQEIRTLSSRALRHLLAATGGDVRLSPPAIPAAVRAGYSLPARILIDVYNGVRTFPLLRRFLLFIGPLFHAVVRKREADRA